MIRFELAGPPHGKERVRRAADGHAYTPERTVSFEGRLAYAAQMAMQGRPPLEGPVVLRMRAYMAVPASKPRKWREAALRGDIRPVVKPDADNLCKSVADSCNLIVYVDDRQIVDVAISKHYSDRPRTEVEVEQIGGLFS